jgi:SAM-dependent methyltransferase
MDAPMSEAPNAEQATYWNELGGPAWAELSALLDRQLETITERAMAVLAPHAGERLLDVGCGCGQTTLSLATSVSPGGEVVGLDISRPMLAVARQRAEAAASGVRFIEADAQTWPFEPGSFDGLFSRFGLMFFADPKAAFRNLLGALTPGGRLVFVCWRSLAENPWMTAPIAAAASHLPPAPPPDPTAPGPFAFADDARVRDILGSAGFTAIEIAPFDTRIGGNGLEDSLKLALRVGPLGARLRENPEVAPKVMDAVRQAVAAQLRDGAVWMNGATWMVSAKRP